MDKTLARATAKLSDDDAQLIRRILESYSSITDLVEEKNTPLNRLRKLVFDSKTETTKNLTGESSVPQYTDHPDGDGDPPSSSDQSTGQRLKRPEHGHPGHERMITQVRIKWKFPTILIAKSMLVPHVVAARFTRRRRG